MSEVKLAAGTVPPGDILVFEYGVRLDKECVPAVFEQIHKSHRLYNKIIEAIREILNEMHEDVLSKGGPEIVALDKQIQALTEQFVTAKAAQDTETRERVAKERRDLRIKFSKALNVVRKEHKDEFKEKYFSKIGKNSRCLTYKLRSEAVGDGLGWATANEVLDNALIAYQTSIKQGKKPRFSRWEEKTQHSLILQFTKAGGIATADLLDGKSAELRLRASNGCGRRKYGDFEFRLGGATDKMYATGTWQYHRSLPEDAAIGKARLVNKRIGKDSRWYLQLQVKRNELPGYPSEQRQLLVTVHLGWAADMAGRRVAGITDRTDPSMARLLRLPVDIEEDINKADELQSERDTLRDEIVPKLKNELSSDNPEIQAEIESLKKLPVQHIALSRLQRLTQKLMSTKELPEWFGAWRKEDRMLWQSWAHLRKRARNRRKNFYQHEALALASGYEAVVIEPLDLKESAVVIDEDTGKRTEFAKKARAGRVVAAVYEFVSVLKWACTKMGSAYLELSGPTATTCGICGCESIIPNKEDHQLVQCTDCGAETDRKLNGAAVAFQFAEASRDDAVEDFFTKAAERRKTLDLAKHLKLEKVQEARRKGLKEKEKEAAVG